MFVIVSPSASHQFRTTRLFVLIPVMRRTFSALSHSTRSFSTSSYRAFPRQPPARAAVQSDVDIPRTLRQAAETEGITLEDFREAQTGIRAQWSADDIVENDNDSSSAGHLYLMQQRQNLRYLRLIEHEMPKLVGERETRNIILIGASLDCLTRVASISQTVRPSNARNAARGPDHIVWRSRASRDREECPHGRCFSVAAERQTR